MYYEGIKTRTIVTSYLATIKYTGILEKQVPDTTTFTVTYKEVNKSIYDRDIFFDAVIVKPDKKGRILCSDM